MCRWRLKINLKYEICSLPWHIVYRLEIWLECKYDFFFFFFNKNPPKPLNAQVCELLKEVAHVSSHLFPLHSEYCSFSWEDWFLHSTFEIWFLILFWSPHEECYCLGLLSTHNLTTESEPTVLSNTFWSMQDAPHETTLNFFFLWSLCSCPAPE